MAESFELRTFNEVTRENDENDDDEEYEELLVQKTLDLESPKFHNKQSKEHAFFTNYNVPDAKDDTKKKKTKKVSKKKNNTLMDIIHSELALIDNAIEENVITTPDLFKESNIYIRVDSYRIKKHYRHWDAEIGNSIQAPNLCPQFPQILENISADYSLAVQYMPATKFNELLNTYDEIQEDGVKFLNVQIYKLRFKSHYALSLEELLVEKLQDTYIEYVTIKNNLNNVSKEITINRDTKDSFKEELLKIITKKEDVKFDPNYRKYVHSIISLKDKLLEIMKEEKVILHKMESLWSDIEMVRLKSKIRKSVYDLEINIIAVDEYQYEEEWNKLFNTELSDVLDKIEYEYVSKYIEYKQQKYKEDSGKKKFNKPKHFINEDDIKEKVYKSVENMIKKERIDIKLVENKNKVKLKKKSNKHNQEKKLLLKMYVDDNFVCQTDEYKLEASEIIISDSVLIQIMPNNEMLTFKLYENEVNHFIHNIKILDINKNIVNASDSKLIFQVDDNIECNSKMIGSGNTIKTIAQANGVRLKSSNIFKEMVITTCELDNKVGWNKETLDRDPEILKTYFDVNKKINLLLSNNGNSQMLKELIETVYNQDISENEILIDALKNIEIDKICFNEDKFNIDENSFDIARLKLLKQRNIGEFSDMENQLIPINSSQISTEQLNLLQSLEHSELGQYLNKDKHGDMNPLEIHRHIGVKYVQNINKNVLKNLNNNLLKNSYKDIVCDFSDLSLRSIFKREVKLDKSVFPPGLKQWQNGNNKEIDLYITVLRAVNLPDRTAPVIAEDVANDDDDDEHIAGFKVRPLRPFVRVNCLEEWSQSVTAIGCHPTWNQTLRLKAKAGSSSIEVNVFDEVKININQDYDDASLHSKTIHYRCYNRWLGSLSIPLHAVLTMGQLQGTFTIKTPPLFLGYESTTKSETGIPNVNRLMKKGIAILSLQITTSLTHSAWISHKLPIPGNDFILKHLNNFITTYEADFPLRKLSLTLLDSGGMNKCVTQFLQPIIPPNCECFPKNFKSRIDSAMSKSSGFSKSSSTKSFESRRNNDSTPRSLEKDSLYSGYDRVGKSDEMSKLVSGNARYVSLIPCYEINEQCHITLSGMELLNILHGSPIDHALLLASYFLYLGVKTWVVVGLGHPRGLTYFVLVKYQVKLNKILLINEYIYEKSRNRLFVRNDDNECSWFIFDATSGDRFELRDASCPLKTVHYVFDEENIWVNIQPSQECESVSFDFTKSSNWRQVFDKTIFTMKLPPIGDAKIYMSPAEVEDLKLKLEAKIKAKIQKWRPHAKTIWNRYCSTLLREMLPQCEYWSFNPSELKPGLGQRLKQLMVTYKVYGIPLNFPFTSVKSAISRVKSTGVHIVSSPGIEFAVAAEIYSYPNALLSVWLFVAAITRI